MTTERQTQLALRDGHTRALAYRECPIAVRKADSDGTPDGVRDFDISISTDEPIRRGTITEVIVHDSIDNFELSRLQVGAMNILKGHASFFGGGGDPFGTFRPGSARVEDGELIVTCRLADDGEMGTAQIARWDAGICTTVSIGYEWLKHEKVVDENGVDTGVRRVLKTKIYECSLVGVPADARAQLREEFAAMAKRSTQTQTRTEDTPMTEERNQPVDDTPTDTPQARDDAPQPTPPAASLPESESTRAFNAAAHLRDNAQQRATQWADNFLRDADTGRRDRARADIERAIRDTAGRIAAIRVDEHQPEMDALSVRIAKIINDATTTDDAPPARDTGPAANRAPDTGGEMNFRHLLDEQAAFERENGEPLTANDAIIALARAGQTSGRDAKSILARHAELTDALVAKFESGVRDAFAPYLRNGIMLTPRDLLEYERERQARIARATGRAQTAAAADNKGDALIQTDVLVDLYVDGLYASSKLFEAGATMLTGLTALKQIPVQSSNLAATFHAETGQIANSDFGIGEVVLTPHRVGIANPASLMVQILTGGAIGRWQMYNVMAAMDSGIENAYLNGDGAGNNPRGLRNTTGIDVVAVATNGGNITVAKLQEPATEIKKDNIFPDGKFTAIVTPDTLTYGQTRARFGTGGDNFIIPEDLMRARYNYLESNLLPTNLTKGTGTNLHAAAFGRFADFFCASFGMPVATFDDLTLIDRGQTRIVINAFVDCVLARKESVKLMNDISVA